MKNLKNLQQKSPEKKTKKSQNKTLNKLEIVNKCKEKKHKNQKSFFSSSITAI